MNWSKTLETGLLIFVLIAGVKLGQRVVLNLYRPTTSTGA